MMPAQDADMMEWVMNTGETAPAFVIARAGYDVWLGNNRGTRYSLGHRSLTKKDRAFWDFYQEDLGRKDVPAIIDFIKVYTGVKSVSYVGHSMGTT